MLPHTPGSSCVAPKPMMPWRSKIYELRIQAGLTQRQLAKMISTTASMICRLEDADYEGHSLAMLNRIAEALPRRVEIRLVPIRKPQLQAAHA